jgi:hypothetical protein
MKWSRLVAKLDIGCKGRGCALKSRSASGAKRVPRQREL